MYANVIYWNKKTKEIGIPMSNWEDINYTSDLMNRYGLPYSIQAFQKSIIFLCDKGIVENVKFYFVTKKLDKYYRQKHEIWKENHGVA